MMMVDNVVALLRPQHDWDHVAANERPDLLWFLLAQAFAFFLDLAHADSDLGGTQAFDRDRLQNRLARVSHGFLPCHSKLGLKSSSVFPVPPVTSIAARRRASQQRRRLMRAQSRWMESPLSDRCQICHSILRLSFGTAMPPAGSYVHIRHGWDAGPRREPR